LAGCKTSPTLSFGHTLLPFIQRAARQDTPRCCTRSSPWTLVKRIPSACPHAPTTPSEKNDRCEASRVEDKGHAALLCVVARIVKHPRWVSATASGRWPSAATNHRNSGMRGWYSSAFAASPWRVLAGCPAPSRICRALHPTRAARFDRTPAHTAALCNAHACGCLQTRKNSNLKGCTGAAVACGVV